MANCAELKRMLEDLEIRLSTSSNSLREDLKELDKSDGVLNWARLNLSVIFLNNRVKKLKRQIDDINERLRHFGC